MVRTTNLTKVWYIAVEQCWSEKDSLKDAHQRCLHQLMGYFGTTEINIEACTIAVDPKVSADRRASICIVNMIGYRLLDKKQLEGWRGWIGSDEYKERIGKEHYQENR
jgi:hypothetical protein